MTSMSAPILAVELSEIALTGFWANHDYHGQKLVIQVRGNADSGVTEEFAQYLERLHRQMLLTGLREVTLDFRELYFMTASCIKCLVDAIRRVMDLEANAQYEICLLTQTKLRWQERSFEVLCELAPHLVRMKAS
ncbi:MAG TPA: hypothetical protein VK524_25060 [Polyangiaceae bacterium]|nr:hypothetical protein [Polyangiaceae bacterium]